MNDPPIMGIHFSQRHGFTPLFHFFGLVQSQSAQVFFGHIRTAFAATAFTTATTATVITITELTTGTAAFSIAFAFTGFPAAAVALRITINIQHHTGTAFFTTEQNPVQQGLKTFQ